MTPDRPVPTALPGTPRIRIVVADDHVLDRAGLVALIETDPGFDVVAEAATVDDCIELCRAIRPDALILALKLCSQEDAPAIPAIRAQLPGLRILALAERTAERCLVLDPPWRKRLRDAPLGPAPAADNCLQVAAHQGAMATLRRDADPEELFVALRMIARGQACYEATTATGLLAQSAGKDAGRSAAHALSEREIQVAALLAEAHSNKEIASLLGISEPTVKKHVRHILEKLGLQDRLQAGLYLARNPLRLEP